MLQDPTAPKEEGPSLEDDLCDPIASFLCSSLLFEDGLWHFIELHIESLGQPTVSLSIDGTPVDLHRLGFGLGGTPSDSSGQSGTRSDADRPLTHRKESEDHFALLRTPRASAHSKPSLLLNVDDLDDQHAGSSLSDAIVATPHWSTRNRSKVIFTPKEWSKKCSMLDRRGSIDKHVAVSETPSRLLQKHRELLKTRGLAQHSAILLGGNGLKGSVSNLTIVPNGNQRDKLSWPLDDSCGQKLRRVPHNTDPKLMRFTAAKSSPTNASTPTKAIINASLSHAQTRSPQQLEHRAVVTWRPRRLPTMALHFSGHSSYVSAVGLSQVFPVTSFDCFGITIWFKDGSNCQKQGCLLSIHDPNSPSLEASIGIYTHTKIDPRTSPKKRFLSPFTTLFSLVDSSERCLAIETDSELYDGLWHKIEWRMEDARGNDTSLFIDDKRIESTPCCEESPSDFKAGNLTLNVGARDEGDQGVTNHLHGDVRCLRLERDNQLALAWAMDEGLGVVCYDEADRIVGRVVEPQWELTTFPPLTPIFSPQSAVEFSPVGDAQTESVGKGVLLSFTIRAFSGETGAVVSIVSKTRQVLYSMTLNEGGDYSPSKESGTHSFMMTTYRKSKEGDFPKAFEDDDEPVKQKITTSKSFRSGRLYTRRQLKESISTSFRLRDNEDDDEESSPPPNRSRRETLAGHSDVTFGGVPLVDEKSDDDEHAAPPQRKAMRRLSKARFSVSGPPGDDGSPGEEVIIGVEEIDDGSQEMSIDVVETTRFQVHSRQLCDGLWHSIRWNLCSDPLNTSVTLDNCPLPILFISRTVVVDKVKSRSGPSSDPDWGGLILGKTPQMKSFHGCMKNVAFQTLSGVPLMFVPLAGTTAVNSQAERDVATSNIRWELSVPPQSCLYLGANRYISVGPLPTLSLKCFQFSCTLRTPNSATPSCLICMGQAESGSFAIVLNENSSSETVPTAVHAYLTDSESRELHVDFTPTMPLFDNKWHTLVWRVNDAERNDVTFIVDDVEQSVRYGECGSPSVFRPLQEGGSIGAKVDHLNPTMVFEGMMEKIELSDPSNGNVHATWELNSGYGTVLTDSSGNRNHAMAIRPIWRTEIRRQLKPIAVPSKAVDLSKARMTKVFASRWSNNPNDECIREPVTKEIFVDTWPTEGWQSGGKGEQWVSFDLGERCTIFKVEVALLRVVPNTVHELWFSRMTPSEHNACSGRNDRQPLATCVESFRLKHASNRVLTTTFSDPHFNVRWIRMCSKQKVTPVGYLSVKIHGVYGEFKEKVPRRMSSAPSHQWLSTMMDSGATPSESASLPITPGRSSTTTTPSLSTPAKEELRDEPHDFPKKPTQAERERELKLLFYTEDVERSGFINPMSFWTIYEKVDVIGTVSKDRVMTEIAEVAGEAGLISFPEFCILLSRLERL